MPFAGLPSLTSTQRVHGAAGVGSAAGRTERGLVPARLSVVLKALNNQRSHVEEELLRMQQQLAHDDEKHARQHSRSQRGDAGAHHHVFVDTLPSPAQRSHADHELASAVELSYQYSTNGAVELVGNIVAAPDLLHSSDALHVQHPQHPQHPQYPQHPPQPPEHFGDKGMPITPVSRPPMLYARVLDYDASSTLARDITGALLRGDKLLLELPDEPGTVSTLLTALGHASAKLAAAGLATALDPVLRVGPAANTHALLSALLRAVLRDGMVTLRTTWFDEEIEADCWSDDEDLDLGGLMILPHTFVRHPGAGRENSPVLYLDVVIA
eukprot:XP_001701573.1 predicted protein [Chlamydomonas reinhardtii]